MQTLTLVQYLSTLNSSDSQWGVWVNPLNVDEYRIGQRMFSNGGIEDQFEYIGNLEELSYGHQSLQDAVKAVLENNTALSFKGKKVNFEKEAMYLAWEENLLNEEFKDFLEEEALLYQEQWAKEEAEAKVSDLEEYFSSEEYQEDIAREKLEFEAWQQSCA